MREERREGGREREREWAGGIEREEGGQDKGGREGGREREGGKGRREGEREGKREERERAVVIDTVFTLMDAKVHLRSQMSIIYSYCNQGNNYDLINGSVHFVLTRSLLGLVIKILLLSLMSLSPPPSQDVTLDVEPSYMDQFSGLNHVLEALRNKDVEPALEWADYVYMYVSVA